MDRFGWVVPCFMLKLMIRQLRCGLFAATLLLMPLPTGLLLNDRTRIPRRGFRTKLKKREHSLRQQIRWDYTAMVALRNCPCVRVETVAEFLSGRGPSCGNASRGLEIVDSQPQLPLLDQMGSILRSAPITVYRSEPRAARRTKMASAFWTQVVSTQLRQCLAPWHGTMIRFQYVYMLSPLLLLLCISSAPDNPPFLSPNTLPHLQSIVSTFHSFSPSQ